LSLASIIPERTSLEKTMTTLNRRPDSRDDSGLVSRG